MAVKVFLLFAASAALCAAQPVDSNLPVLKEPPREVTFRVSSAKAHPFTIPCATTTPNDKVVYTWTKNGKPFPVNEKSQDIKMRAGEGTLIFNNPKDSDEGVYQCLATSTEGVAGSRPISVKKTFVDIPKYTLQKHTPEEGKPFKMECSVTKAYPKPVIEWYRQGKDGKYLDIMEKRLLESPEGDLYFTNVTKEDVSKDVKYVCLVATQAADDKLVAAEHIIEDLTPAKGPKSGELTPQYLSKDMTAKTGDIVVMMYCIYGGTDLTPAKGPKSGELTPQYLSKDMTAKTGDIVVMMYCIYGAKGPKSGELTPQYLSKDMTAKTGDIVDLTPAKGHKSGELTPQYLSKDMTAKTGDIVVMMYCIYGGTPMAHPDWFKISRDGTRTNVNGQPGDRVTHRNRSAGRRLWITKVLADDDATYECVANNGVGKPQSHKIKLTVQREYSKCKINAPQPQRGPAGRSLWITKALVEDDATYECVANNGVGKPQSHKIKLAVQRDAGRRLWITKALAEDDATYECVANNGVGKPQSHKIKLTVQQTHRNRSAGRRLWITKALAEDDATYECVANNGVGKPQIHKIKLTVQQAPEFTKQPEPVMLAKVGDDVTIPCKVRGAHRISWSFNGQPLEVKEPTDTLTLSKVQKKDNGYYACMGSSDVGDVYAETLVHVA
ncbi:hemolin-like [Cydia splendana]|uniref:hemolin-like n=1 Tax=Cydia splendana TaxID=1100963 RepID=UPI00300CB3D2